MSEVRFLKDRSLLGPGSVCFGVGVWALGLFLESILPPLAFGFTAFVFITAGVCLTAAAFLPETVVSVSPLRSLRHWIKPNEYQPQSSSEAAAAEYISFVEMLRHIALRSEWAYSQCPSGKESIRQIDKEAHAALSRGDIQAFGTRYRSSSDHDAGPTPIPTTWWAKGQFDPVNKLLDENADSYLFQYEKHGGVCYEDAHVRRADVLRKWPEKSALNRVGKSPFARWQVSLEDRGKSLVKPIGAFEQLFGDIPND